MEYGGAADGISKRRVSVTFERISGFFRQGRIFTRFSQWAAFYASGSIAAFVFPAGASRRRRTVNGEMNGLAGL